MRYIALNERLPAINKKQLSQYQACHVTDQRKSNDVTCSSRRHTCCPRGNGTLTECAVIIIYSEDVGNILGRKNAGDMIEESIPKMNGSLIPSSPKVISYFNVFANNIPVPYSGFTQENLSTVQQYYKQSILWYLFLCLQRFILFLYQSHIFMCNGKLKKAFLGARMRSLKMSPEVVALFSFSREYLENFSFSLRVATTEKKDGKREGKTLFEISLLSPFDST